MLRIAIYQSDAQPLSINGYAASIRQELEGFGVRFTPFDDSIPLPTDVDIYWDPTPAGGSPPRRSLLAAKRPIIATVHGAAPMALSGREYFGSHLNGILGCWSNFRKKLGWRRFRDRLAAVITASEFAREEISTHLGLSPSRVTVIAHGVAHDRFRPGNSHHADGGRYLLHLSQYQPLKNVERMVEAFERISGISDVHFKIVAPGLPRISLPSSVSIVRNAVTHDLAAELYRAATGFLFPSLRESFGMPILEAMACGCPVVTSHGSACEETAGGAAMLVDPYSVDQIADAMSRLASDPALRKDLARRGIERAAKFSWRRSAEEHLAVFETALCSGT